MSLLSSLLRLLSPLLSYPGCLLTGLLLRVALIYVGVLQDASASGVKYTDVDYAVYTDAAALVAQGESPYARATYRYTPLLAWVLVPTSWGGALWPHAGKMLFALMDVGLAACVRSILRLRGLSAESATRRGAWLVLFNPLVINLSTRGNADTLIVLLVLLTLWSLMRARPTLAALLFGLAVHVKIYPIIYALAMVLFLNADYPTAATTGAQEQEQRKAGGKRRTGEQQLVVVAPAASSSSSLLRDCFHPLSLKLRFTLVSAGSFVLLTAGCYLVYGRRFVDETYLYHVVRADTRHNFSVWFTQLYLQGSEKFAATAAAAAGDGGVEAAAAVSVGAGVDVLSRWLPLLSFLPQLLVLFVLSLALYRDLPLFVFASTLAFVSWNKVVTAQYFLWWMLPLMLVAPQSSMGRGDAAALAAAWLSTEVGWLYTGLRVEFRGESAFTDMWAAGLAFFAANITMLAAVIVCHRFTPVFRHGIRTSIASQTATEEQEQTAKDK